MRYGARGTHTCKRTHTYTFSCRLVFYSLYILLALWICHMHTVSHAHSSNLLLRAPADQTAVPIDPAGTTPNLCLVYCQEGAASQYPYPSLNVSTYGLMAVLDHCTVMTTIVKSRLLFPSTIKWIALIIVFPSPKAMTSLQHYWTVAVSSQSTLMLILKLCIRIHHKFLADSATRLDMSFTPDALLDTTPPGICVPGWN